MLRNIGGIFESFFEIFDEAFGYGHNKDTKNCMIAGILCNIILGYIFQFDDTLVTLIIFSILGTSLLYLDRSFQPFKKQYDHSTETLIWHLFMTIILILMIIYNKNMYFYEDNRQFWIHTGICIGVYVFYMILFGTAWFIDFNGLLTGKHIFNNVFTAAVLILLYKTNPAWNFDISFSFIHFNDEILREGYVHMLIAYILHLGIRFIFTDGIYLLPFKIGHIHLTDMPSAYYSADGYVASTEDYKLTDNAIHVEFNPIFKVISILLFIVFLYISGLMEFVLKTYWMR